MTTILPWLPAFFFGGVLILVGMYLQSAEKKKRLGRKQSPQGFEKQSPSNNPLGPGAYPTPAAREIVVETDAFLLDCQRSADMMATYTRDY